MAMQNMAYSSAIGQGAGVYGGGYNAQGGAGADRAMGGVMSAVGAAAPLATGAMGLLGLSPMSLGLKAGMSAFGAGAGLGGAALAGGAVALPLMAAAAGVHYMGGQMYEGAGQQSQLNDTLRQSFTFRNQYGGQGFQRSEMSSIGTMVRQMSEQFGPGGEITSFRELTGLAGKMGQMGFAQGVRDVQDFSKRFKEMVTTLKTMAKDLGSTLEGAMEFAQAAKGSGVFGMNAAGTFAATARQTALSGGLAMSEVTGAASIGSQISRSIGGLGRQGAMGGMRTIGQIGTATQMGLLSEEDIYNVTGLTGAEGRQAFAASSMQQSARFLQSGRGRRMLASMAGKNGTLDEAAVQQILGGGMGIGETMQQDQVHLAAVGRANFIRNEGRLRGAALERLGGFLPAMQLSQWAASKGISINDMDDRSMLFAQRQLGMGRDEIDQAVKMANAMPQILEQQQNDSRRDQYFQGIAQARKGRGIEGVKQRLEHAKEHVNGKLQKLGQDFFNQGSEMIDSFINDLTGQYVQTYSADIDEKFRTMTRGGAAGQAAAMRAFGIGGTGMSAQAAAFGAKTNFNLGGAAPMSLVDQMTRGSRGGIGESLWSDIKSAGAGAAAGTGWGGVIGAVPGAIAGFFGGGQTMKYIFQGQSGAGRMQEAGFNMQGLTDFGMRRKLDEVRSIQGLLGSGMGIDANVAMRPGDAEWIRDAYAHNRLPAQGDARIEAFGAMLQKNNPEAYKQWAKASTQADKALLMQKMEMMSGIRGEGGLAARYGVPEDLSSQILAGGGKFASVAEENKAYARAFFGDRRSTAEKAAGVGSKVGGALLGGLAGAAFLNPFTIAAGAYAGYKGGGMAESVIARQTGSYEFEQAAGAFLKGKEFRNLSLGLLSSDAKTASKAREDLQLELGNMSIIEQASPVAQVKEQMLTSADYLKFLRDNPEATDAQKMQWAKDRGTTVDKVGGLAGMMYNNVKQIQKRDMSEMASRAKVEGQKQLDLLTSSGVFARDSETGKMGLSAKTVLDLKEADAKAIASGKKPTGGVTAKLLKLSLQEQTSLAGLGGTEATADLDQQVLSKLYGKGGTKEQMTDIIGGMSAKEKMQVAMSQGLVGTQLGQQLLGEGAFQERFAKMRRGRGGTTRAAADILGLDISKEEAKAIGDISKGGDIEAFIRKAGVAGEKDKAVADQLREAARTGKGLDVALKKVQESEGYGEKKKAESEARAAAENPLQAKMVTALEKMEGYMKTVSKNTTGLKEAIAEIDTSNPATTKESYGK